MVWGPVVWIPRIPLWKGLLGVSLESQTTGPQTADPKSSWQLWGKEQAAKEAADAEVQALQFLGMHGWGAPWSSWKSQAFFNKHHAVQRVLEFWPTTGWNSGPNWHSNKPQHRNRYLQRKKDRRWKAGDPQGGSANQQRCIVELKRVMFFDNSCVATSTVNP